MSHRFLFLIILLLPGILAAQTSDPFDELVREKKEIFGSEREEKYPVRALVYDLEKWEGHTSWHALWLIRKTDYPKFNQFRIFPFYNSISAKSGKASMHYLFPFYSYRFVDNEGVEDERFLSPLYYKHTIQPSGGGTGYRASSKFYWLAYQADSSGLRFEKNFFMFPGFFPIFMRETEVIEGNFSSSTMIPPLLFFNRESANESKTNLALFYWGKDQERKFFHFFPLIYYSSHKSREDYSFTLFPLFHQSRSNVESAKSFTHYSPFWFEVEGTGSGVYSNVSMIPFLLYYQSKSISLNEESSKQIFLPLALYSRNTGENSQFRNFLLFQWGKEKEYRFFRFLPLIYWSGAEKKQDAAFTFLPVYHHNYDGDDFTQFTLLPIPIYRHIRKLESETLVLNAYLSRDAKGDYLSSFFFPLYFHKKGSYFHVPFLSFFHFKDADSSETFAPFFYKYNSPEENELFLLGYHGYSSKDSFFNRLYPFYYSSRQKDGSSFLGLAGLFYRWKDSSGETTTRTIFPFHYYRKNETHLWFPFYFRFGGDDKNYLSFSPIHYRLRSQNTDRDWILFYYSSENRDEKSNSTFVAPLYFNWKSLDSRGDILLPFYLKYYEKNKNLELYLGGLSISQTGGRFDASFKSGESGKEFYVDADYSFIYNIFSVSLRKEVPNPLSFFGDDKSEETSVLPTDKNAINTKAKKEIRTSVAGEEKLSDSDQSGFGSYKKLARENSRNYFGWEALFGIASYQSGDDKRHFRVLPLAWFSWNSKNADNVWASPLPLPTFWGTIGDESYRVVFPLYAEQKKGSDFVRSIGIFLFVMEQEKDRREYSLFWPLTRISKSKEEIAFRFFPFFAHKESAEKSETKSILYYRSKEKNANVEHTSFHGILFPFYQASEEIYTNTTKEDRSGYSMFFPFYFRNYEDRTSGGFPILKERNLYTPLFLTSSREDSALKSKDFFFISPIFYVSKEEKTVLEKQYVSSFYMLLPIPFVFGGQEGDTKSRFFLGHYKSDSPDRSSWNFLLLTGAETYKPSLTEEISSFYVFPFYFGKTTTENGNWKYKSRTIPIFYSSEETPDSSETSILLLAGTKSNKKSGLKRSMFLPIWYHKEVVTRKGFVDSITFIPIFFQTKSVQEGTDGNIITNQFFPVPLLYTFSEKYREEKVKKDVWGFDWLFFANFKNTKYLHNGSESTSFKALLAFIGYEKNGTDLEHETSSYLFPLFFYKSADHKEFDSYRLIVPIVAYRSFSENQGQIKSRTNFFGFLLNYKRDDEVGSRSFYLFPNIYFSTEKNGEKTVSFLPIYHYSRSNSPEYSFFIMGYYQGRNSQVDRYNFLYLVDLQDSIKKQKRELSLFLGVFHSEFEKDRTRWAILGGLLAGYESTPQITDWNFLWIRYLNSPQERVQNFLPVYRYSETSDGYSFLAPPILTYHSVDKEGSLTLGGLGLFYYKNRSEREKEESTKVLGGIAYFSHKKAERGYQTMGVFGFPVIGGLIWQYEYEEETGFEKTSVFKFIYSKTTIKGVTFNRIFGIKF
ncbi:hypothetical protein AB3N59_07710 [Leptospira sp. WS92.C1]